MSELRVTLGCNDSNIKNDLCGMSDMFGVVWIGLQYTIQFLNLGTLHFFAKRVLLHCCLFYFLLVGVWVAFIYQNVTEQFSIYFF